MHCADVENELVPYHFASCSQETRDALRQHLRGCLACAQSYFDLKQDIDSGEDLGARPSEPCQKRLRRDVEGWLLPKAAVGPAAPPARWSRLSGWLLQPTPRYRAVLGAAVLGMIVIGSASRLRPAPSAAPTDPGLQVTPARYPLATQPELPSPYCEVDSARLQALSITYY